MSVLLLPVGVVGCKNQGVERCFFFVGVGQRGQRLVRKCRKLLFSFVCCNAGFYGPVCDVRLCVRVHLMYISNAVISSLVETTCTVFLKFD